MLTAFILILAIVVFFADFRGMNRQSTANKEIVFSSSLLGIGVILGVVQLFQVPLPSLMTVIEYVFRPVSDWMTVMLK